MADEKGSFLKTLATSLFGDLGTMGLYHLFLGRTGGEAKRVLKQIGDFFRTGKKEEAEKLIAQYEGRKDLIDELTLSYDLARLERQGVIRGLVTQAEMASLDAFLANLPEYARLKHRETHAIERDEDKRLYTLAAIAKKTDAQKLNHFTGCGFFEQTALERLDEAAGANLVLSGAETDRIVAELNSGRPGNLKFWAGVRKAFNFKLFG